MRRVDKLQRWLPNINGGINTSQTCRSFSDSQCCHSENLPAEFWPALFPRPSLGEMWRHQHRETGCLDEIWKKKKKRDIRTLMKVWNLRVSSFLEIQVNFQAKDKETEKRMQRFKLRERWLRYFVSHCSKCLGHWRRFWHPFCRLRSSSSSCCL